MSTERAPQPQDSAEIIYLLVPPSSGGHIAHPSLWQRVDYGLWRFFKSEIWAGIASTFHAVLGAVGFVVLCAIGLYVLYYVKSIMGIDLFSDKHLEDFVPVPGYGRWR